MGQALHCCACKEVLSLDNINNEVRKGLFSILHIKCHKCGIQNEVNTGKKVDLDGHCYTNVNLQAVLGAMHSGLGCTGLNKILACLNIPVITMDMFKRYERKVGLAIEKAAVESCQKQR
ncbi:uncharacterized protein LOC143903509 [Temnothorax americanus]|uniref:uncharacterized protein LOC143903509 n=1 Tax=Temnothorax americanus TaxID=1964332 RepID=UPI0040690E45